MTTPTRPLSLSGMLNPDVLANPRDPFLHARAITRYDDVAQVLGKCRTERTPARERLTTLPIRWQA